MNGSTGTTRHDAYTEAMFRVQTSEAFAESTWCAGCLIEYVVECGMGACVQYVGLLRFPQTKAEQDNYDKVLALAFNVEQP
ncbi:hypothetical protein ACFYP4_02385 [Streptomyces sp. NPDC005551]|uniref:hypothetical protein n=1 Tax=Streptomyces sp. NPDC005551 TaxID=3364725 RepID=UPI0036A8230F